MKHLTPLLILLSIGMFNSCSKDTITPASSSESKFFALGNGQSVSLKVMLDEVTRLEKLIVNKRILKYNTQTDKEGISQAVYASKVGLLLLSRDQENSSAVLKLSTSLDEYQSYMVMSRDKAILEAYFSQVALITKIYAKKLDLDIKERSWKLLNFEFSSESLAPFNQVRINADSPKWSSGYGGGRAFAKIDTNFTNSQTWLVSPRYSLSGLSGAKLVVENVVRNLDFSKAKIMVSTNYNGGNPQDSDWEEFAIEHNSPLEPGRWTDVVAGPYDLSKYEGKEIVVGFKLDTVESDSFTWELLNVQIWGVGSQVGQTFYDISYQTPKPVELYKKLFTHKLELLSEHGNLVLSGDPAAFEQKERNGVNYLTVSGFGGDNSGETMLYTEAFDLSKISKSGVQVTQAINYYKAEQRELEYLKIVAFEKGQASNLNAHIPLKFKKSPMGSDWNAIKSEELQIPSELQGKEVSIGFIYKSQGKAGSASWNLYDLTFYEMDI